MSFKVPMCATCGHAVGDHQSGGSSFPHPPAYGLCLMPGCGCKAFVAEDTETRVQRQWLTYWPEGDAA